MSPGCVVETSSPVCSLDRAEQPLINQSINVFDVDSFFCASEETDERASSCDHREREDNEFSMFSGYLG